MNKSRKVFKSSNWCKARLKVAKAHRKIADIRAKSIHHLTSYVSKNHAKCIIEDLNVKGLLKNRNLTKAIADSSFGMIREQLQYKCDRYESTLVIADRFFPSSQLCSNCSHRQKMPLAIRTYNCPACGMSRCRDLNAALNLENYEALAAGLVASRSVDEVLPTVSAEADSKHQCQDLSYVV
ncbi:transposase [Pleurocapsales cyanobacterium LEGE 06147]|nr:transposase [Pleurocapsales cyanobacterium LEGE 06147]